MINAKTIVKLYAFALAKFLGLVGAVAVLVVLLVYKLEKSHMVIDVTDNICTKLCLIPASIFTHF